MKNSVTKIKTTCLLTLIGLMIFNGCDDFDFKDINVNPSATEEPLTSALLTNSIWAVSGFERYTTPSLYVQYLSQTQYPDESNYSIGPVGWSGTYAGVLADLQTIIQTNTDPETAEKAAEIGSNANQIAIARILKAFVFSKVSDQYGDVPYSEALTGIESPVYDDQESIYMSILTELREAESQFDSGPMPTGDILLNGSQSAWKRLANSLRMVLSQRLSKRYPDPNGPAATEFNSALNDPDGYIMSNSDNVEYPHLADNNWANRWWSLFNGREDFAPSDVLVDKLIALNDPRLAVYANQNTTNDYVGVPYGFTRDELITWTAANDFSRVGDDIRQQDSPSYMITAAHMAFVRSEAAEMGWTTENAQLLYEEGIRASWEQRSVFDATEYATYLTQADVIFTGNTLEKIGNQKWIALFPDGLEMWSDWRRTGYPVLTPSVNAVNESGEIPLRYPYPSEEQNLNEDNYKQAVSGLSNGDKDDSAVWWDN